MSISPPSDIVLDVARAADPARYQVAAERLNRMAPAASPAEPFADVLDSLPPTANAAPDKPAPQVRTQGAAASAPPQAAKAYRSFEAMTLATFIESAFPDDAPEVFGSGTAGSVWKSMLAEQIADQMSKSGGIGIADQIARAAKAAMKNPDGAHTSDASPAVAPALVSTIERGFLKTLTPDKSDSIDSSSP